MELYGLVWGPRVPFYAHLQNVSNQLLSLKGRRALVLVPEALIYYPPREIRSK